MIKVGDIVMDYDINGCGYQSVVVEICATNNYPYKICHLEDIDTTAEPIWRQRHLDEIRVPTVHCQEYLKQ